MRTTVTLDPDVEKLLRRAVRERGHSFKKVLNSAIRHGLTHQPRPKRFRQKSFDMGPPAPGINLTKALQLAAELEDAAIIHKLKLGK